MTLSRHNASDGCLPMSSLSNRSSSPAERALFRRVSDGTLTPDEFQQLERRLTEDEGFRQRYVLHMGLEASLYEAMAELPEATPVEPVRRIRLATWPLLVAASSLALGIIGGVVTHFALAPGHLPIAMEQPAAAPADPVQTPSTLVTSGQGGSQWHPLLPSDAAPAIAMVTDVDVQAAPGRLTTLKPGQRLAVGRLEVAEGRVQLEFINGAQILLQGPAVLQVESALKATLVSGQAAARVPDSARGFVLNSPGAAVVDLGTEFAVSIDEQGRSEVQVTDGEVEVSLLGADGNTIQSERLRNHEVVRVNANSQRFDALPNQASSPLQIPRRVSPPLAVGEDYVNTVIQSGPFAYWRFEDFDGKQVTNEMGSDFAATFVHENEPQSVTLENGRVTFHASQGPRYFSVKNGIPGWNSKEFTIELWACPDRLHHGAVIDLLSNDWSGDLNTIEIAMKTAMIHPPGAFRFFHRHPPGQSAKSGINLFDHVTCVPGQWYHLVATKSPDSLAFYINGELVRRIDGPTGSDNDTYQVVLGQMDNRVVRQFEGSVDEVALYNRALPAEEVLQHFRLLMPLPRTE